MRGTIRRLILVGCGVALVLVSSCGGNSKVTSTPADGSASLDAATTEGSTGAVTGCLDQPDILPIPPEGSLPCDLIPPGLTL